MISILTSVCYQELISLEKLSPHCQYTSAQRPYWHFLPPSLLDLIVTELGLVALLKINGNLTVCSTACQGDHQKQHESSTFMRVIKLSPVDSPHKWPVLCRKYFIVMRWYFFSQLTLFHSWEAIPALRQAHLQFLQWHGLPEHPQLLAPYLRQLYQMPSRTHYDSDYRRHPALSTYCHLPSKYFGPYSEVKLSSQRCWIYEDSLFWCCPRETVSCSHSSSFYIWLEVKMEDECNSKIEGICSEEVETSWNSTLKKKWWAMRKYQQILFIRNRKTPWVHSDAKYWSYLISVTPRPVDHLKGP